MKRIVIAGAVAGAAIGLLGLAPAQASESPAMLSVLHGVPDLTVDVYVNDELTLDDFTPGTLAGPLELPAGTYSVAITAADATDASAPAIGPVDLTIESGMNYTVVAHLTEAGDPTATLFTNDTATTAAGEGRLTVRHVAAAPAVDVLAAGSAVISDLTNPNESKLDLPAGTISASVAAAGTTDPVIGPADVDVAEGANTIVYAWGSLDDGNLALAIQTVTGMDSAPGDVPAGSAGLVATNANDPTTAPWIVGGSALLLAIAAVTVVALRRGMAVRHEE
ncbi:DUF4397 domain-containing protein [Agromyces sp. Leaf222]|uniref:DUF4397 domain-containing protein n=1 Tax=Agromyces sp. Leaf222 TaxID=1735688 RepID=UPI0006F41D3F|nr:DUF4397 domain-containing protein [Agromyces sp. Leaf222]KQM82354.1 hypothetical protein ASE68_02875 [Agromyces sp. Leaf222]